jgi:glyoxylase-like metal-dependent hydrolase (beta-lactamase superfamily II)
MSSGKMVRSIGVLLCLTVANLPRAFASGEPQESFLYQNFVRASEIVDRAVEAHGGVELLDRSIDVHISFTGTVRYEGHYPRPWAYQDYRMEGTTVYSADLKSVSSRGTLYEEEGPSPFFTIVGPRNGIALEMGGSRPDSIPEKEVGKALRRELEMLPHEYLRQARAAAASLRWLPGSDGHDVVCYSIDDGGDNGGGQALYFATDTHLLTRVERIDHFKLKGDRLEWRTFSDYADRDGVKIPLHSEVHVEEYSTQYNVISEVADIEFGAAVSADEFTIPAASRTGFEGWALAQPKAEPTDGLLPSHDLGKGAYIIDLPPSTARSLLVAFSDFSVIVEAGDYSEISAQVLATADHLLPKQPVRYVAMTHHHPLYANGLRPYAQRGITILATAGNVEFYRDLTTRPYRIHPDEQQRQPREPKFEVIKDKYVIKGGKQRLEFYEFDYSTHTDEYVLPYLPSHKLIVTGDMVYILRDAELGPARPREKAIYRLVKERKLDVDAIMQTWFLQQTDNTVPFSILEEKVRMADAQKP